MVAVKGRSGAKDISLRPRRRRLERNSSSLHFRADAAGANVVEREVVVDGNIVTSRKPIPAFIEAFVDLVEKAEAPLETA